MEVSTRRIHDALRGEVVAYIGLVGSVASIVALVAWVATQLPTRWVGLILLAMLAISLLMVVGVASVYSLRIRQENRVFRDSHSVFHSINHNYRDVLSCVFGVEKVDSPAERAQIEKDTLRTVCEELSRLFLAFAHVPCIVTVKLVVKGRDDALYARTLTRSQGNCSRDKAEPIDFQLKTGKNTGLDRALERVQGQVSHFFSPDLFAEKKYNNERQDWRNCYRTAIVVPIRHVTGKKDEHGWVSDNLGFLAVDALSENRLNNTFHVHMLAACADQMYNFMSLMRGKYSLEPLPQESQSA